MDLTFQIPDDLARRLSAGSADLPRRALEALALQEYRDGRLTKAELRRLLGFETRAALDEFFKAHNIMLDYTIEDLEQERRDLRRLGF